MLVSPLDSKEIKSVNPKGNQRWIFRRIDVFEMWCWRRLLRVLWTARRSNQSILKEISPEYLLVGLMLKIKLQYFGHLCKEPAHWNRPHCWERLRAGREGGVRGWDGWMRSLTQWTWIWANSRRLWRTGKPGVLQSVELQRVRHNLATEQWITFYDIIVWYCMLKLAR